MNYSSGLRNDLEGHLANPSGSFGYGISTRLPSQEKPICDSSNNNMMQVIVKSATHSSRKSDYQKRLTDVQNIINDFQHSNSTKNWDGYGAEPVKSETLIWLKFFLTQVLSQVVPLPETAPESSGNIMLSWTNSNGDSAIFRLTNSGGLAINLLENGKTSVIATKIQRNSVCLDGVNQILKALFKNGN